MKTHHTLHNYFALHKDKAIDFCLRVHFLNEKYKFSIHPANLNGETWHFGVNQNVLEYIYPSTPEEETQMLRTRIDELETKVLYLEEFQRDYETRQLEQGERG